MNAKSQARTVAVLCVSGRSIYKHLPQVIAYDRIIDARTFPGGMPVIAHPPCRCWSKALSHQAKPKDRQGEMELGLWCVDQVKRHGGVLEQPAQSRLWVAAGLPHPGDLADPFLYTVYIEQSWFGFPCRKATWILVAGIPPRELPRIPYRMSERPGAFSAMNKQERSRTMPELANWLLQAARATWHSLPIRPPDPEIPAILASQNPDTLAIQQPESYSAINWVEPIAA